MELWSYNEWNGGKEDYLGKYGLTDEMLINRFGEVDIKLMVPDKTMYLNSAKGDTVEGAKQLDQERYGFEQLKKVTVFMLEPQRPKPCQAAQAIEHSRG